MQLQKTAGAISNSAVALFLVATWAVVLPVTLPIPVVRDFFMNIVKHSVGPSIGYLTFIILVQRLLCQYVLLQDPTKNAAIDNRRIYHLCAYILYTTVRAVFIVIFSSVTILIFDRFFWSKLVLSVFY